MCVVSSHWSEISMLICLRVQTTKQGSCSFRNAAQLYGASYSTKTHYSRPCNFNLQIQANRPKNIKNQIWFTFLKLYTQAPITNVPPALLENPTRNLRFKYRGDGYGRLFRADGAWIALSQRRHHKVIEEAPATKALMSAPLLIEKLVSAMSVSLQQKHENIAESGYAYSNLIWIMVSFT